MRNWKLELDAREAKALDGLLKTWLRNGHENDIIEKLRERTKALVETIEQVEAHSDD